MPVGLIQRSDTDKPNRITRSSVVAPNRDSTLFATPDLPSLGAVQGRIGEFYLALQQLHTIGFDKRVESKGGTGFALTPPAAATVNEKQPRGSYDV